MLSKKRENELKGNIWKFYIYRVFCTLTFITPVFVLFYLENQLNMTQVMVLEAIYTLVIVFTLIPGGILADYVGRRKVLLANSVFFLAGWIGFALSSTFTDFLISNIILGTSSGLWFASGTAFFYDNLKELKKEKTFKKRYGTVMGINFFFWGISSLIGGYIALHSLRLTFWVTSISAAMGLLVALTLKDTQRRNKAKGSHLEHLKGALNFIRTHKKVRLYIIYSSVIYSINFAVFILYQPYFRSINIQLVYFGWIYLAMNLVAAIGAKLSHLIEAKLREQNTLFLFILIMLFAFAGLIIGIPKIGFIFPVILSLIMGVFDPVIVDYVNKYTSSHHRATVLSLNGTIIQLLSSLILPIFGFLVDAWGLTAAFILGFAILSGNMIYLGLNFLDIKMQKVL